MGRHVSLRQLFNAAPLQTAMDDLVLFEGQIESIETAIGPEGETVELTARDFSAVLERITVYGQHVGACTGGTIFLSGLETAFNPGGKGNAGMEAAAVNGQTCTVFCAEAAGSQSMAIGGGYRVSSEGAPSCGAVALAWYSSNCLP